MPDLHALRDLPELRPLPGQVEAALVEVRVRRRRSAFMTLTSATASVVALALLLSHSSGVQSLQPVSPDVATTATAAPAPEGPGGEATTGSGPRFATASPTATVSATPAPDETESPVAAGPREKPPVLRTDYSNLTNPNRKVDDTQNQEACGPGVTIPTNTGWCQGALPVDRGMAGISLQENICAPIGQTVTRLLRFVSTHEAEIVVYDDADHELWRSSVGVTYRRSPHVLSYTGGDCSEWSVLWDRTDESGQRLAPGWYWFRVTVLSDRSIENASRVHVV